MKKKIPTWVVQEIRDMVSQNVNIYDWDVIKSFLALENRFTMLEWVLDNRDRYYYCVLSKQFEHIENGL